MTNERVCANGIAMPKKPHSELNPYHKAIFLHEMIQAAVTIVETLPSDKIVKTGLSALLDVIGERANALQFDLDAAAFCECWPAVSAALGRDAALGFRE
ncbi:hypothetical protein [Phaeobacter sp. J2-8]|uniref:hypothetical protein n=1 Tax=Phaeobacter sp. J2-8 TaxID=2931394 RepID=UPI001FD50D7D|nr:hypothetical protein [Phaeobacter sp. J2-8]MCJ7871494.1 hypothetical protein [Phaeobacter sp. J2-8]